MGIKRARELSESPLGDKRVAAQCDKAAGTGRERGLKGQLLARAVSGRKLRRDADDDDAHADYDDEGDDPMTVILMMIP